MIQEYTLYLSNWITLVLNVVRHVKKWDKLDVFPTKMLKIH